MSSHLKRRELVLDKQGTRTFVRRRPRLFKNEKRPCAAETRYHTGAAHSSRAGRESTAIDASGKKEQGKERNAPGFLSNPTVGAR